VILPMRRTIFMALLAALLLAPAAFAQGNPEAKRIDILRDCQDDGMLTPGYKPTDLRDARNNIPAELDEYSDCRDVLTRAIAKATAGSGPGGTGTGGGAGGGTLGGTTTDGGTLSGGPTGTTGGSTSEPGTISTPNPAGNDSGQEIPKTPQEWRAITQAQKEGERLVAPKAVSPGANRLAADVGRNGLPGMLVAVLALIAAAALALVAAPLIRRRGLGART
jgi:hypothetical protein